MPAERQADPNRIKRMAEHYLTTLGVDTAAFLKPQTEAEDELAVPRSEGDLDAQLALL